MGGDFPQPFPPGDQRCVLTLEKFRYYLTQDYLYLEGFARSVALALAKAPDSDTLESLAHRVLTPVERPLHHRLMEAAGVRMEELRAAIPSPTNLAYINHMVRTASEEGLEPQRLLCSLVLGRTTCWGRGLEHPITRSITFGLPSIPKGALKRAWLLGVPTSTQKPRKQDHGSASPCDAPSSPAAVMSGCFGEWRTRWRCGRYDPYAGNSSTTPSACCMSKALMTCITSM